MYLEVVKMETFHNADLLLQIHSPILCKQRPKETRQEEAPGSALVIR